MTAPNSYRDPFWAQLAANSEERYGLPSGILRGVLLHGEQSNANQVSSAGARTPFQIIPSTRAAILDQTGVDPYLSPQNAADGAGYLLRQSLDRNQGDIEAAIGEYHGGTDRSKWGPVNRAYRARVMRGMAELSAGQFEAAGQGADSPAPDPTLADRIPQLFDAYKSGRMDDAQRSDFAADVRNGVLLLPHGAKLDPADQAVDAPPELLDAFSSGVLDDKQRAEFAADVRSGALRVPSGFALTEPEADSATRLALNPRMPVAGQPYVPDEYPHWRDMPEMNQLSMAGAKAGLGGALAESPEEAVKILQSNFPSMQVRQAPDGSGYLAQSADGREYQIPTGYTARDIPSTVAKIGAFVPSTAPAGLIGQMVASAATEAALQGIKSGAGGNPVSGTDVAISGAIPAVAEGVARGVKSIAQRIRPALQAQDRFAAAVKAQPTSVPGAADDVSAGVAAAADDITQGARRAIPARGEGGGSRRSPAAGASIAVKIGDEVHVNYDSLADLMMAAGQGDKRAAQRLAESMRTEPAIEKAAKSLGFGEDDLPLQWFLANQSARDVVGLIESQRGSELRSQSREALSRVGQRATALLDELGAAESPAALDAGVKGRMQTTRDGLKASADSLYSRLRESINPATRVQADNIKSWLDQRVIDMGGIDGLETQERRLIRKLSEGDTTYGYLDRMRMQIGEAIGKRADNKYQALGDGLNKQLYAALSKDIKAAADSAGALDLLTQAKSASRAQKHLESAITGLFGKDAAGSLIGNLELSVGRLRSGDVSKLSKLLQRVPEDMRQEVVATGLQSAFNRGFKNGQMSFKTFADWFDQLENNKQAYAMIMSNLPADSRHHLVHMATLARGIARSEGQLSTTGLTLQAILHDKLRAGESLMQNLFGLAKRSSVGLLVEPFTTAMGIPGSGITAGLTLALAKGKPQVVRELDALVSSPEFAHLVRSVGTEKEASAIKAFARKSSLGKLLSAIGVTQNREAWVRNAIQNQAHGGAPK